MKKRFKLPNWVYWVWLISIVSLGLSLTSIFWGYNIKWNVEIVSTALILGFVGILATFIVVSNYSQVRDIQADCAQKTQKISDEFNSHKDNIESMIQALNRRIELLATTNSTSIDTSLYQILGINHNDIVENWYILIKGIPINEISLTTFSNVFCNEYCKKPSNLNIVDSSDIYPLITKYPLEGNEYITVADHFVALKVFDMEDIWMYPYQDIMYKEYGGANWKKTPPNN